MGREAPRLSPIRAALGSLLVWGAVIFLFRTFGSVALSAFDQIVAGRSPSLDRLGIVDRPLLVIASAIAVALFIVGVLVLKGAGRFDRPGPGIGYIAGAMVAYSLLGGLNPGVAEFVYEANWAEWRRYLPLEITQSAWFILAAICAYVWLRFSARRAHLRRLAGLNHPSDGA